MALETKILSISNPSIAIDEMAIDDYEKQLVGKETDSKKLGALYPFVQVNGYKFDENEIVRLSLDISDFYPTVSITVASTNGVFLSKHYPKDGDPVSLFIRSRIKEFKPIRLDFEIIYVSSAPSTDSTGEKIAFTINGIIRIPNLHSEVCKSYKDMTSYDTLKKVSEELQLGFASNETKTDDKMTWLCPFDSYKTFIEDTTEASYKDDDSFYMSFIDSYYHLNFVNLNNQFSEELNIDEAIANLSMMKDYDSNQENKSSDMPLILSNLEQVQGSSMFIDKYTLLNNTGSVGINNGYRRYMQFYDDSLKEDKPENKYKSFSIEALNTKGAENDKVAMKGRKGENIYDTHSKYKWLGVQYGSKNVKNVHDNYQYAKILNHQNNIELDKMLMRVILPQANFNLYRGQRVPVVIVNSGDLLRKQVTKDPETNSEAPVGITYDKFLSGYYVIKEMKYTYDIEELIFRQDIILSRREWPVI